MRCLLLLVLNDLYCVRDARSVTDSVSTAEDSHCNCSHAHRGVHVLKSIAPLEQQKLVRSSEFFYSTERSLLCAPSKARLAYRSSHGVTARGVTSSKQMNLQISVLLLTLNQHVEVNKFAVTHARATIAPATARRFETPPHLNCNSNQAASCLYKSECASLHSMQRRCTPPQLAGESHAARPAFLPRSTPPGTAYATMPGRRDLTQASRPMRPSSAVPRPRHPPPSLQPAPSPRVRALQRQGP